MDAVQEAIRCIASCIAALNAVSDLYAMNARPFSALAIANRNSIDGSNRRDLGSSPTEE